MTCKVVVTDASLPDLGKEEAAARAATAVLKPGGRCRPCRRAIGRSRAPNLHLDPHAAWYSEVAVERLQSRVADEITRALAGQGVRKPIPGSTA